MYIDVLKTISSISENFKIYYAPHFGLSIYNNYDLIAEYSNCSKKKRGLNNNTFGKLILLVIFISLYKM